MAGCSGFYRVPAESDFRGRTLLRISHLPAETRGPDGEIPATCGRARGRTLAVAAHPKRLASTPINRVMHPNWTSRELQPGVSNEKAEPTVGISLH
jgi:hypothetical protein